MCPYIKSRIGFQTVDNSTRFEIPNTDVLYGQFDDDTTLRAFKILSVLYGDGLVNTFLRVIVAGIGEGYVCANGRFFASQADYVNNKTTDRVLTGTYYDGLDRVKSCPALGTLIQRSGWGDYLLYRYAWRNNQCESIFVHFYVEYDVPTKQLTLAADHREDYPYTSKEECILDNQVAVATFDYDPIPEPKEFWVSLPTTVAVTAKTEDEAKEKVRKGLYAIIR